jgi:hypothetical protein
MPTITGTEGTDILSGGTDSDTIFGLSGNDQLTGNGGDDLIDGGAGNDILSGSSGIDTLTGGTGSDVFRDTAAGLNGDRITDLLPGDRIQITNLAIQDAIIGISGSNITFNGNVIAVDNLGPGRLIVREIQGGGVEIRLQDIARNDFNGDGRSDVLWRNSLTGDITNWLSQSNGGFTGNTEFAYNNASSEWNVVGTGDFNGDGRADILWRNDNGRVTNWLGNANGGFTGNIANAENHADNSWEVVGTGDFNGDGRDDVLWRNSVTGDITNWLCQPNGGFAGNTQFAYNNASFAWHVVGTGDFNGDGRADILWRNDNGRVTNWLGTAEGGFTGNIANAESHADMTWEIEGIGDFNGDGRDDVLWRNSVTGDITNWLCQPNGGFSGNTQFAYNNAGMEWHIVGTGDYNGDGRDDILWRNDNGRVTNWLGNTNGGFAGNIANAESHADNSWQVQDYGTLWM